jgi:hypothetical protein
MAKRKKREGSPAQWKTSEEKDFSEEITLQGLIDRAPFKDSKDSFGHGYLLSSRVPEWFGRKIKMLIEAPGSPYQTEADVIRDCCFIGMFIVTKRMKFSHDWIIEAQMHKIIDTAGNAQRILMRVKELAYELKGLVDGGDRSVAIVLLSDYLEKLGMKEDAWSRKKEISLLHSYPIFTDLVKDCTEGAIDAYRESTGYKS